MTVPSTGAPVPPVRPSPSARLPGGWRLPLLLSVLPVLFLAYEADRQAVLDREEAARRTLERTAPAARLLRDGSAPGFPARFLARRLKQAWETIDQPDAPTAARAASLTALLPRLQRGFPDPVQVWAVVLPGADPALPPEPLTGPGLATHQRTLFTRLLTDVLQQEAGTARPFDGRAWESRLRGVFSFGCLPTLFQEPQEGSSLPVVFARQHGQLVWQTCRQGSRLLGAFVVILTPPPGKVQLAGLRFLAARWRGADLFPAFLPMPAEPGPASGTPMGPPACRLPGVAPRLARWLRRSGIGHSPNPGDLRGRLHLPWRGVDRLEPLGPWWIRVCPLDPETGRLGVLLVRRPPVRPGWLQGAARLSLGIWVLAWLWAGGRRWRDGTWPQPGLRAALFLWFGGLAAVPMLAGLVAGTRFAAAHQRNLQDGLARTLTARLETVAQAATGLWTTQEKICRAVLNDPWEDGATLLDRLERHPLASDTPPPAILEARRRVRAAGVAADSVVVFLPDGRHWTEGATGSRERDLEASLPLLQRFWAEDFRPPEADTASDEGGTGLDWNVNQVFRGRGQTARDQVDRLWIGRRRFMGFASPLRRAGQLRFVVGFIWDMHPAIRLHLEEHLRASPPEPPLEGIAAFAERGLGWEPIARSGATGELGQLVGLATSGQPRPRALAGGTAVGVAFPLPGYPGFCLAARAPLAGIRAAVARERALLAGLLAVLLAVLVLVGQFLATWLAGPMVRMARALEAIAAGRLETGVAEPRPDELGQTSQILDRMIAELRTRRDITPFVPPPVLAAVAGGNLREAVAGRRERVVVLTSDMREFTTLSETHPPGEVFRTLNTHLAAMAAAIQDHGGTIDRFIGDAVVAVFTGTRGGPAARRAVAAARAMRRAHLEIQGERRGQARFPYEIGIGIDIGEVVSGVVGDGEVRLDFTVLGEVVAQAAELENLSRTGSRTRIVLSAALVRDLPDIPAVPLSALGAEIIALDQLPPGEEEAEPTVSRNAGGPADSMAEGLPPCRHEEPGEPSVSRHAGGLSPAPEPRFAWSLAWGMALWLIVGLGLAGGWHRWLETRSERSRHDVEALLAADVQDLSPFTRPDLAATFRLQEAFPPVIPGEASYSLPLFPDRLRSRLELWEKAFPGMYWAWLPIPAQGEPLSARFDQVVSETGSRRLPGIDRDRTPPSWEALDVGGALPTGRLDMASDGSWTMTAGGAGLGGYWDDAFLAFRPGPLDRLTARVRVAAGPARPGTAGLMVRNSLFGNAPMLFLGVEPGGVTVVRRSDPDDAAETWGYPRPLPAAGTWLRLARVAPDAVCGQVSDDGQLWSTLGTWTFPLDGDTLWGLSGCARLEPDTSAWPSWPGFSVGGRLPPAVSSADLRHLLFLLWREMYGAISHASDVPADSEAWIAHRLPLILGLYNRPFTTLRTAQGTALPASPPGGPRLLFQTPVLTDGSLFAPEDSAFRDDPGRTPGSRFDPDRLQERQETHRRIRGVLFLSFPADRAPGVPSLPWLLRRLQRRGAEAALFPAPTAPGPWPVTTPPPAQATVPATPAPSSAITQAISQAPSLPVPSQPTNAPPANGTQAEPSPATTPPPPIAATPGWPAVLPVTVPPLSGTPQSTAVAGWVTCPGPPLSGPGPDLAVVVARPLPAPLAWYVVPVFGAGAWLAAGWWLWRRLGAQSPRFLPLRRQLLGGFVVAVFPALVLAALTLERSHLAQKTRLEADVRAELATRLEALDASSDLTRAWTTNLLRQVLADPTLADSCGTGTDGAPHRTTGPARLQAAFFHLLARGLPLGDLSASNIDGRWAHFNPDHEVTKRDEPRRILGQQIAREVARAHGWPAGTTSGRDMMVGAQLEETLDSLGTNMGPDMAARFMMAPDVTMEWFMGTAVNACSYLVTLPPASGPAVSLIATFRLRGPHRSWFLEMIAPRRRGAAPRLSLVDLNTPAHRIAPPVDQYARSPKGRWLRREWARLTPPADHRLGLLALARDAPVGETRRGGRRARLALATPFRHQPGWLAVGEAPLGPALARLEDTFQAQRVLLFVLLCLTLWLARQVADQFLTPIARLATAADRVAAGDFSVRISCGEGGEFGALTTSFDRMAEAAQEGRLLGRFVSDATLATLRQGQREAFRGGETRQAVVLFVSLAGFKDLLPVRDPHDLIRLLNTALTAMSRTVREEGGDIDKFIGDKLLAFFPLSPDEPAPLTVARALRAALHLPERLATALPETAVRPAAGVTVGPVLFGAVGAPSVRLEMTIIGDTVNLAARLADLAAHSGEALLLDGTAAALASPEPAGAPWRLEPLPATRIKGKRREVEIFRCCPPA